MKKQNHIKSLVLGALLVAALVLTGWAATSTIQANNAAQERAKAKHGAAETMRLR